MSIIIQHIGNKNIMKINSRKRVDILFKELDEFSKDPSFIYRGQNCTGFKLIPGIYRFDGYDLDSYYLSENNFFSDLENNVTNERFWFYANLQHYGLRTKLLDFTHNPFIALWFATNNWLYSGDKSKENCELFIVKNNFKQIPPESLEVFGELLFLEKEGVISLEHNDVEKAHFSNECLFVDWDGDKNCRIGKQEGCFLMFPNFNRHDHIKDLADDIKIYKKYLISHRMKKIISNRLESEKQINIYKLI